MARGGQLTRDEYATQWTQTHLGPHPRRATTVVRGWLRLAYLVGRGLAALGLPPSMITLLGLLLALPVPVLAVVGGGWLFVAAGLVLLSAVADAADGSVAIITSRVTRLGSFYDSLADRLAEAAWLAALWLVGAPGWLVTVCGGLAWLHEYARARAAACGMAGVGVITVAERPTRVALMITALVLAGLSGLVSTRLGPGTVTIVTCVWILFGLLGAARLTGAIRSALRHS